MAQALFISKMTERIEDLQYKGLRFIQNSEYFAFGTDAVLLARFATCKKNETIVDFGTGTGIIPVLLAADTDAKFYGIELQEGPASLAQRNAELNGLSDKITILNGDIRNTYQMVGRYADVVICNPPYDKPLSGAQKEKESLKIARYEIAITIKEIIASAAAMLQTAGRFYMIHRTSRLAELIYLLKEHRLEPKNIRLVQSQVGKTPNYVLIACKKDAKEGVDIPSPLIIYEKDGSYTKEMKEIYHLG